jgi:hypothetical protein
MKYEFWRDWKRKTELEEAAIRSLKVAKRIILENIPRKEIVAIYAKGSFIRRELNKKSDVDTVTILKSAKYFKKFKSLSKHYRCAYKPALQFGRYSMKELVTGKKLKGSSQTHPGRFVKHLKHHKIIYGVPLEKAGLFMRSDEEDLRNLAKAFRTLFLPKYRRKEIGFSDIVKQVFWIAENEERLAGNEPPHNWRKLEKSVKLRRHPVHEALDFRLRPDKDPVRRRKFIKGLEVYLDKVIGRLK